MIGQVREAETSVLLLDGGDSLVADDSQPLTVESKSALIVEAMNLMGYDAAVLGERDLQLGPAELGARLDQARFAILSANVRLADTGELVAQPYAILEIGGWTIGVVGLTGTTVDPPPAFSVSDPIAAISTLLPELSERVDTIVVLSHLGWTENKRLADLAPEIDLVIGGGAGAPDQVPYRSDSSGAYLAQAEHPTPGHAGRQVGRWDVERGAGDQVVVQGWTTILLGPEFADEPTLVDLVQRYQGQMYTK